MSSILPRSGFVHQSVQAGLAAERMYPRLGVVLEARGDDPAAAIQLERALAVGASIRNNCSSMMFLREMLIAIARRAGQSERVARYTAAQAAFIKANGGTTQYAGAMSMLSVAQARKGDYIAAISAWDYVVKFRRELCGKTSTEYVAALRDLALLHRMHENTARAKEIELQADAMRPSAQDITAAYARRPNHALHSSLHEELASEFVQQLKAKGTLATDPTLVLIQELAIALPRVSAQLAYSTLRSRSTVLSARTSTAPPPSASCALPNPMVRLSKRTGTPEFPVLISNTRSL